MAKNQNTTTIDKNAPLDQEEGTAPIVIEASWAPADPRDKLYDKEATGFEKVGSITRIIASFHPIFNSLILLFDLIRRGGVIAIILFCALITAVTVLLMLWLP